jgi:hypothetical protein
MALKNKQTADTLLQWLEHYYATMEPISEKCIKDARQLVAMADDEKHEPVAWGCKAGDGEIDDCVPAYVGRSDDYTEALYSAETIARLEQERDDAIKRMADQLQDFEDELKGEHAKLAAAEQREANLRAALRDWATNPDGSMRYAPEGLIQRTQALLFGGRDD